MTQDLNQLKLIQIQSSLTHAQHALSVEAVEAYDKLAKRSQRGRSLQQSAASSGFGLVHKLLCLKIVIDSCQLKSFCKLATCSAVSSTERVFQLALPTHPFSFHVVVQPHFRSAVRNEV